MVSIPSYCKQRHANNIKHSEQSQINACRAQYRFNQILSIR
jgi:hypothetical protein